MISQFARTEQLLGPVAVKRLAQSTVAVFGLGAVGSFAVEALARCGIGSLCLIDFDRVDPSNINRQLYALHSTVGMEKVRVARDRILDINPSCRVAVRSSFVNADSIGTLLDPDTDIVVDAIDGLNAKVNLIVAARDMGLTVVSSMGAAGRIDMSKIMVDDISRTRVCPLARVVRRRLHRRGLFDGVHCVYSVEKPMNSRLFRAEDLSDPLRQPVSQPAEAAAEKADHGRERPPIGSVPFVTGAFGLYTAMTVVRLLTAPAGG